MINKENLEWLTQVPGSDPNFKTRLEDSNIETIEEALKDICISEGKRKKMEIKLKKLKKEK